jgi:hypothetical protein
MAAVERWPNGTGVDTSTIGPNLKRPPACEALRESYRGLGAEKVDGSHEGRVAVPIENADFEFSHGSLQFPRPIRYFGPLKFQEAQRHFARLPRYDGPS